MVFPPYAEINPCYLKLSNAKVVDGIHRRKHIMCHRVICVDCTKDEFEFCSSCKSVLAFSISKL